MPRFLCAPGAGHPAAGQNGSFNYTRDAAAYNSENVVVFWNHPQLAQAFLQHWKNRWAKGMAVRAAP